ncbi:hypothetical protein [Cochleicola gelatinilyticus]|uniref:NADH dehydrogenase n=1 Tax=Cochleicola gelatinilyticus TaxID=1763537 RepID=A0A167H071_9FLAO|nr:hypothetical protein [Cochleicola gelatinilyticus]OAB78078.1 hypothetical protein ULVI_11380 [Cochleicola gelatinilyticus]
MTFLISILQTVPEILGIFILMLSAFLIGYFSSWWLQKSKYSSLVSKLKRQVNSTIREKNINNIDVIFTEIKPKIIEVIKDTREELHEAQKKKKVQEKTRSNYVSYTKNKPSLNFDSFGIATSSNRDKLTNITGIGPYIEEKLNEIGIYTFEQLSNLKENDIRTITELIEFFPGRIDRDDWVGQAKAILKK